MLLCATPVLAEDPNATAGIPTPAPATPAEAPNVVPLSAPDAFALGRNAFGEAQFEKAAQLFGSVVDDAKTDPRVRRDAAHLLGRTLMSLPTPLPSRAAAAFETALNLGGARTKTRSDLTDWMRFGLAQAKAATGSHPEAAKLFARIERDPHTPLAEEATLTQARMWVTAGEHSKAAAILRRALTRWPDSPRFHDTQLELAKAELARKRRRAAAERLRDLIGEVPESRAGLQAKLTYDQLVAQGYAHALPATLTDDFERIEYLVDERRFEEARPALITLQTQARARGLRSLERRTTEQLLRVQYGTGEYVAALGSHAWLTDSNYAGLNHYKLPRAHAFAGDFKAVKKAIQARYKGKRHYAYYMALGEVFYEFGRYKEAYRSYYRARALRGRSKSNPTDRMVWCLMRMGEPAKAAQMWETAGLSRSRSKAYTRYWYARALQLSGKLDKARPVFEHLAKDLPHDYYGIQAWSRLQELDDKAPEVKDSTFYWEPETLTILRDHVPQRADADVIEAQLSAFGTRWSDVSVAARRAAELGRLGLHDDALAELRVVGMDLRSMRYGGGVGRRARADMLDNRKEKHARGGASAKSSKRWTRKMAREFKRRRGAITADLRRLQRLLGDAYGLRRDAFDSRRISELNTLTDEAAARDAYPIAWPDLMEAFTQQFGVPPYYAYSIMTVESAFHPHAISVSDAYGLLQMIPKTGRHVSRELGYTEFRPELLLQPEVSVYFGTYYLGSVLKKFHGQEPLGAAAYNAGPHRVAAWLTARPDGPMDMFIEEIPFGQARRYTKTMTKNVARYHAAHHGQAHTYVSNALRSDFLASPNY
ncbi:MAG: soluble lytic murein transglycosylase-like protein [Myxococcota bacterium]|jgi:soluble lytic murein transglycosylase-like protein